MPAARVRLQGRALRLLLGGFSCFFLLTIPIGAAAAGSASDRTTAAVDALWNQPQGVRADSSFYIIQAWWSSMTTSMQRDPTQRGLAELQLANSDLLNAYTMLVVQHTDPGPHPVALIDPLLSTVYGAITGNRPKAPLGSLLGWINKVLLNVEGRGSADAIIQSLLRDQQARQAAAERDLHAGNGASLVAVWTGNWNRQDAILQKIQAFNARPDAISTKVAQVQSERRHHQDQLAQARAATPPKVRGEAKDHADGKDQSKGNDQVGNGKSGKGKSKP